MYQLTIEQSFDAAHFLAEYRGKCGNIHGHRWRVLLEIETEALQENDQERGMCVDFSVLKEELKKIVDRLDHNFLIERGTLKDKTLEALEEEGFCRWNCLSVPRRRILPSIFMICWRKWGIPCLW